MSGFPVVVWLVNCRKCWRQLLQAACIQWAPAAYCLCSQQEAYPQEDASAARSDPADRAARGFLGRKSDGEPRAKTAWVALRDVAVFVNGMRAMRDAQSCV